jgi:hypothetical protein
MKGATVVKYSNLFFSEKENGLLLGGGQCFENVIIFNLLDCNKLECLPPAFTLLN